MTTPAALLDSNVIIACLVEAHEHHAASFALFTECNPGSFAVAAHSFAEAYATLTRPVPYGLPPATLGPLSSASALSQAWSG